MAKKKKADKSATKFLIRKLLILIGVLAIVITPIIIFSPKTTFIGEVTGVYASAIRVEVTGDNDFNGSYLISVSDYTEIFDINKNVISLNQIRLESVVKIDFKGTIKESNPALIDDCRKITIV